MALIEPGTPAPAFSLPDQHGTLHTLAEYKGRPVVLYFYPKDDTSGCTKEACGFQEALPDFGTLDAAVFGVSILDTRSKSKFATKYDLAVKLGSDPSGETVERYGAWVEKSLYGRKYMGVARVTYLIDADGTVARRWDTVKVDTHPAEVLAAVEALKAS